MSFDIAISGLNAINEQLGAISNNIANSGTVGFKSGRAEFASLYAEGQPLGVGVTNVAQSISKNGTVFASASSLDLAINGQGFFVMRDSSGTTAYTRAGYMQTDSNGNLVNNQGMYLQGYPVDANGVIQTGTVGNLTISSGSLPAKATSSLDFTANLNANEDKPKTATFDPTDETSYNHTYATQVYDSLGREHTLKQYFVKTDDNTWQVHYYMDDKSMGDAKDMTFNEQGILLKPNGAVNLTAAIPGADSISLDLNYNGTTQFGSDFSVSKNNGNGYASGERTGQTIDKDGSVYATFSNGERLLQGQVVLANFSNPNGLSSQNGTTWTQTASSGAPLLGTPGTGLLGALTSNTLEGSNVNLTDELVGLMTAQRNYQANTKVISTNDSMMTALFQAV
ncbi:flagellar hook protein FlgE [Enterobacter cancerogenus]|jgi:flagellar hook protein FlgE|uniref:Flagellar hook protein FlgE n=1 Tax=Enterobacter cancerogenus TaxID=69218 RepID=A0ABX8KQY3_9ENTR|nr:flagellar hook protein FlgE [Enterobacter cancerogenus]KTQ45261.1 flagellar hook protein FlgE [Enterobacter cancerogenus]KTQ47478.1 flagellar hook protein FlgE [Enterobacter cancerogenus]KTQ70835.1 flagellar hook protein FlgE [Enterobacter cancerogenus]KTQ76672.1 flagellar hook protein FlgE [Enterobacter cancerogenus]MDT7009823.1 flagellar hook protein FlgE [Enterobacter cancerogenus]